MSALWCQRWFEISASLANALLRSSTSTTPRSEPRPCPSFRLPSNSLLLVTVSLVCLTADQCVYLYLNNHYYDTRQRIQPFIASSPTM
jgi:hypothetical protein